MPLVCLDTNLLILVIVGRTDPSFIAAHKRTNTFDARDFLVIETLIAAYDGVVTTPHILAETSNLLRQIRNPARDRIQHTLHAFIATSQELAITSEAGCSHPDYLALGLTDAVILSACKSTGLGDGRIELLTADEPIYNRALSLGLPAELYA
jgi:predicted nucleic acid-binding protein